MVKTTDLVKVFREGRAAMTAGEPVRFDVGRAYPGWRRRALRVQATAPDSIIVVSERRSPT